MGKRDYYRNLIKEVKANQFTKKELEVLEVICNASLGQIFIALEEPEFHTEEYIKSCKENEPIIQSALEKVRKM